MIETFVFTCCTGRCGSAYLANLFDGMHEPFPKLMQVGNRVLSEMIRDVAANNNESRAREYLSNIKLPHIRETWHRPVYLESAHTFSKGFLVPLIDLLGTSVKVIRLRRQPTDVVASLLRLRTIPPANGWYLRGTDEIAVAQVSEGAWSDFSPHERCTWYVEEIERQWCQRIKPRLAEHQRFEVDLKDILTDNSVLRELEKFIGLPLVAERIGQSVNSKR